MATRQMIELSCYCVVLFGIISSGDATYNGNFNAMKRLFVDLLEKGNYNKLVAPLGHDGKALTVTFNLDVKRLVALNTEAQVLSLDAVISMMWFDSQLTWNQRRYGNISMIRLPSKIVWQPDIILYNSADQFKGLPSGDIHMVITPEGFVVYSPLIKTNSFCTIQNKRPKPGDMVTCSLKFGSWVYDGLAIDLMPAGLSAQDDTNLEYYVDLSSLEAGFNRQWELVLCTVKRNVITYPCCPEPYIDLTYKLMIKYKGDF